MNKEFTKEQRASIDRVLKCTDFTSETCKSESEVFAVSASLLSSLFIVTLGRKPTKEEFYSLVDKLYKTIEKTDINYPFSKH